MLLWQLLIYTENKRISCRKSDDLDLSLPPEIICSGREFPWCFYMDLLSAEPNIGDALSFVRTCHLVTMLENSLYRAKSTKLQCSKVLVPKELTTKVAQEALKLSLNEPCGLRGCIIYVNLENNNRKVALDTLVYDCSVEPTFELKLVLKQDTQGWDYLRDLLINRTCFPQLFRSVIKLSPKFHISKRRLYFSVLGAGNEDC
ncbi:DNA damage-inducible transcript 4-like protein [Phyllobates terribilis]|uniref:DNA damage-inducible transcript 4-like protein n=1 Tax=Phyllobates terribilis TaxID=111132 RepID=UPI003CCABBD1